MKEIQDYRGASTRQPGHENGSLDIDIRQLILVQAIFDISQRNLQAATRKCRVMQQSIQARVAVYELRLSHLTDAM